MKLPVAVIGGVGNCCLVGLFSTLVFRSAMEAVLWFRSKQEQRLLRSKWKSGENEEEKKVMKSHPYYGTRPLKWGNQLHTAIAAILL